jgi:hypothetical protein
MKRQRAAAARSKIILVKTDGTILRTPGLEPTTMSIVFPQFRPPPLPEPTPVVRVVAREDVGWDRPLFRAPPLEVYPIFGARSLGDAESAGDLGGD